MGNAGSRAKGNSKAKKEKNLANKIESTARGVNVKATNLKKKLPAGDERRGSFTDNMTAEQIISESTRNLSVNQSIEDTYTIRKKIGSGQYGEVFEGIHIETGVRYAIKKINKKKVKRNDLLKKEMEFLLRVNHPNIVNVVDLIEEPSALYIVQEYCSGQELFDRIIASDGGFQEKDAAKVIGQLLSGIAHCHHEVGIVHRDLKPENILYKTKDPDSEIVIIDFGLSATVSTHMSHSVELRDAQHDHLKHRVGTPYYIAPEVFSLDYSRSCDIWSVGIILYILLCGYPPYNGRNEEHIMASVKRANPVEFPDEEWGRISDFAKRFITRLLQKDPSKRPTALEALEDPWFQYEHVDSHEIEKQIDSRLHIFHSMNKLKKMAAMVIVEEGTVMEVEELKRLFKKVDVHNSGFITREEFREVLSSLESKNDDIDLEILFHELDQDGGDTIDYDEFIAAAIRPAVRQNKQNVDVAFDYFDTDKDGYISVEDLESIVGSVSQARLLIGEVDFDHDQRIGRSEFAAMMLRPDHKTLLSHKYFSDDKIELIATEWRKDNKDSMEQDLHFNQNTESEELGLRIDAVFEKPNQVMVIHHIDHNSLAEEAGLKPLHILLKIDGVLTNTMDRKDIGNTILEAIQGESGCTVTVGVLPSNAIFQQAIGSDVDGIHFAPDHRKSIDDMQ